MIYFDIMKNAHLSKIKNPICIIENEIWEEFHELKIKKDWDIINGEFIDLRQTPEYIAERLLKAKKQKLEESTNKLNEKRYGQLFTVTLQGKECEFDTTEQTQKDLNTAGIVIATNSVYPDWTTNNGITLDLTQEDLQIIYNSFFPLVSPLYKKELIYKEQIENAQTIEEVQKIEIDYNNL